MSSNLSAIQLQTVDAGSVGECDFRAILSGLSLSRTVLGRGSYGVVVKGSYNGLPVAIKLMVTEELDRTAVRELLLSPRLVHNNLVSAYLTRCCRITSEFMDELEGPGSTHAEPHLRRVLQPVDNSNDGFGVPAGSESDPLHVLHPLLAELKATTGQMLSVAVQELCERGSLLGAIRAGIFTRTARWDARVALRALLRTAAEVARGLLHLHAAGVVHGDLKPANVLLKSLECDRRGFIAKVADFGLARVLPHAAGSVGTDNWGSVMYMAPEAFAFRVSRATDVWAFGVVLWEMLETGRRPYEGLMQTQVMFGVSQGTLSLQWPDAPEGTPRGRLVRLGRRCTSFEASERPGMEEVLRELVAIEVAVREEAVAAAKAGQKAEAPTTASGA